MAIQLIVGLANPGAEYATTRHNAGAWWLQALCAAHNINFKSQSKLQAQIGEANINGHKFRCAIPTTYMNHSGQAVGKIANYFDLKVEDILIAHDELDFAPGIIRLKNGGGHGGHNGLRDIIPQLGSDQFHRLRIGIGHPGDRNLVSDYVTENPSRSDRKLIDQAINDSLPVISAILTADWQGAKNILHQT
jgi:PTH1 family peptidyl-tRNA hydrolase